MLLALPIEAQAKCVRPGPLGCAPEAWVSIRGPGLEEPIVIEGQDFWRFLYLSGADYGPSQAPIYPRPSGEALGPRYEAQYYYSFPVAARGRISSKFLIEQVIYPYAPHPERSEDHMAWVLTPEGQRGVDKYGSAFEAYVGWTHSAVLSDLLFAHGLPAAAPPAQTGTSRDDVPLGSPANWIALAALGVLFLVGAAWVVTARPSARRRHPGAAGLDLEGSVQCGGERDAEEAENSRASR